MTLAIELENLHKTFAGSVRALDGVSLSVEQGTIFGLLGPNGAGKTTAVRILTTVLRPDSGVARVLGHDVTIEPEVVRRLIGLAGQFAAVDENLTGAENLWMVGRLNHMSKPQLKQRSSSLLEQFGLSDAANRPTKTYSGGMRRRLDVAASLVAHPRVLFLDEPTTGLDPASRADVWTMIEGLVAEGTTVLLTTQYLEEADRLAEHLVVINHGKVIAAGTPATLKANMGVTVLDLGLDDERTALRAARGPQDGQREGPRRVRPHGGGQRERRPPRRHPGAEDSRGGRHRPDNARAARTESRRRVPFPHRTSCRGRDRQWN